MFPGRPPASAPDASGLTWVLSGDGPGAYRGRLMVSLSVPGARPPRLRHGAGRGGAARLGRQRRPLPRRGRRAPRDRRGQAPPPHTHPVCGLRGRRRRAPAAAAAVTGGVACELVHLGSLYHDDVIDEAETRRGVPSVNARWSNIVAILAGDYLLARASSLAASLGADVAALLAATIGELCRGQVLELQHLFDVGRTEESYSSAIEGKTAALFATSCRVGGMVSDVDEPTLDALTRFGHHLGMCFQVVDDVLDLTSTDEALGKHAGQDLARGHLHAAGDLRARATAPSCGRCSGGPLDGDRLDAARSDHRRQRLDRRRARRRPRPRHQGQRGALGRRRPRSRRHRRPLPPRRQTRRPRPLAAIAMSSAARSRRGSGRDWR